MLRLTLLSVFFFLLPIAVTIGLTLALESQRIFFGKGAPTRLTTNTYCEKLLGITPYPARYIFNPNVWGDPSNTGVLCMNITTDSTASADEAYAAPFSATWQYPPGPVTEPVHAFPNAELTQKDTIPIQLSAMSALTLDVEWSYALGDAAALTTDANGLQEGGLNCNVAVDMFMDPDLQKSTNTSESAYEVMIWLGRWGLATDPIGIAEGVRDTLTVNSTTFDLYYGTNALGQNVFTWIAEGNTTIFAADITPLIQRLAQDTGPVATDYLGYAAFGSEALYSSQNVTFYVPRLEMNIAT